MNKIPEHWFIDIAEFFEFFLQYTAKNIATFVPDDVCTELRGLTCRF